MKKSCDFILIMESTKTSTDIEINSAMDELYGSTLESFIEGTIINGKIVGISNNDVIIDVGYKSEGIIPMNEFTDLAEDPIGEQVEVYLEQLEDDNGAIVISKKRAEQQQAWDYVVNECKDCLLYTSDAADEEEV